MTNKELRKLLMDVGLLASKEATRPKLLHMIIDAASDIVNR